MKQFFLFTLVLISYSTFSQTVTISINATQGLTPISPWIYGKNNNTSDDSTNPLSNATWQKYRDAGLRMYRENGGNNATKYNWRLKLSSHPDWYNNVYSHDWDFAASSILTNTTNTQGFYAFQLLGKAASNKKNNFDDWAYNQSQWWTGASNNWAGGGNPNAGNPNLYLENWPADSSTGIIKQWFETLKLDSTRLRYWNMDNEPEIWSGTHDDVVTPTAPVSAEAFMQKYFAVAKMARLKFPGVKLVGPVSPNEWQWYNWDNKKVTDPKDGKAYAWMEYFIKRIGEEEKVTGIRLLDVLDVHFYPATQNNPDLTLQLHRLWFDTEWVYPGANGVKATDASGWNESITKEYFFERCNQWLNQYLGLGHKVTFGVSEYGTIANNGSEDANVIACWYASHLGVFANKGVELFTPWDWYNGQWEVMHLFSNFYGKLATQATSDLEDVVSGYSSVSSDGDSLMIVIVNKDRTGSRNVDLNIQNFAPSATTVNGFQLANLPATETFVSKASNALQNKQFTINANHITLSVPKLSVTLIQIPTKQQIVTAIANPEVDTKFQIFPNPATGKLNIQSESPEAYIVVISDMLGRSLGSWNMVTNAQIDISNFDKGMFILQIIQKDRTLTRRIVKD